MWANIHKKKRDDALSVSTVVSDAAQGRGHLTKVTHTHTHTDEMERSISISRPSISIDVSS